jgi:hypothetical protein
MPLAFLTIFLGLMSGTQSIALAVNDDVAVVELALDDHPVAQLAAAPWMTKVDFGSELLPHHLSARALNQKGEEIARIEQWINLPRPRAELEILVNRINPHTAGVRVNWQSLAGERPDRIELSMDGSRVALDHERSASLHLEQSDPRYHVVAAQAHFPSGEVAERHVAIGSGFAGGSQGELTAIPVRVAGNDLPAVEQLVGWFTSAGHPLAPTAVERGASRLLVVRDPGVPQAFSQLLWFRRSRPQRTALAGDTRIRFIWPSARPSGESSIPAELFPGSQDFGGLDAGLPTLVADLQHGGDGERPSRLADAVAVAGLTADAEQSTRAVLLVLTPGSLDSSRYRGDTVRRYLAALGVPLFVWSVGAPSAAAGAAWGNVEDVSQPAGLQQAMRRIEDRLRDERMVWVEGRYLPQTIELGPPAVAHHVDLAAAP